MSVRLGNVLYMLAYAYRMPHDSELNRLQSEEFDHASDLYAAVMIAGVERKLRTGLSRGYVTRSEDLSHPRGSISIEGSMRLAARRVKALSCIFHEYKVDTPFNRLIKAVMRLLSRDPLVAEERKTQMRLQLKSFMGVSDIRPELLEADQTAPRHAGKTDRLLHAVSFLVLDELLPNQTSPHASGRKYLSETKEERMHDLYEQFVREYYRFHYRNLKVGKEQIRWKLSSLNTSRLPIMETDISLQDRSTGKKLIIDTKYYGESMKGEHGKKLISANLYQLFAYVMNDDPERTGRTGGLLLYARTDEEIIPDDDFQIIPGNNYMGARTLDLTGSWTQISGSLDNLVRDYFGFCPD